MKPSKNTAIIIDKLATESEDTRDLPLPMYASDNVRKRGHNRVHTLEVRMNNDEFAELMALADERGLPVSTVARSILVSALRPANELAEALDKIESGIHAIRGQLVPVGG